MSGQDDRSNQAGHRADYILEFGIWRATCRVCGWHVTDPQRRQAASHFRHHIRGAKVIDLRQLDEVEQVVGVTPSTIP